MHLTQHSDYKSKLWHGDSLSPSSISSFYNHQHRALWMAYTHCHIYETGSDRSQLMESTSSKMNQKFDSPTEGGISTSHIRQLDNLCNKDNTVNSNITQLTQKFTQNSTHGPKTKTKQLWQ